MKTIKVPDTLYREAAISFSQAGETDKQSLSMSISSDEPYLRYDWFNDSEYYEIIDHSPGAIEESRLKAGLPILFNHDRDMHLATAKAYAIEGGKCTVKDLVWSSSDFAQVKKKDAESGVLTTTSVGYRIIDDGKQIGTRDGRPVYKFKVEIFEGSLVTIPADISVGVGRQRAKEDDGTSYREITIEPNFPVDLTQPNGNKDAMTVEEAAAKQAELDKANAELKAAKDENERLAAELKSIGEKSLKDIADAKAEAKRENDARVEALTKQAADFAKLRNVDCNEALVKHIAEGKSLDEFKSYLLAANFKDLPHSHGSERKQAETMKRSDFSALSPKQQRDFCASGGKITD